MTPTERKAIEVNLPLCYTAALVTMWVWAVAGPGPYSALTKVATIVWCAWCLHELRASRRP